MRRSCHERHPRSTRICVFHCAVVLWLAYCALATADESSPSDSSTPSGVKPSLIYNGAAFADVAGGAHTGATYTSNLNVQLDIDAAALLGWPDTIAYLDRLWLQGGLPSNFVGDARGVSNISAPNSVKIYEAWLQKNFSRNQVSVLAGLGRVERFAVLDAESMVGGVLRLVGVARRALRRVAGVGFFMMLGPLW